MSKKPTELDVTKSTYEVVLVGIVTDLKALICAWNPDNLPLQTRLDIADRIADRHYKAHFAGPDLSRDERDTLIGAASILMVGGSSLMPAALEIVIDTSLSGVPHVLADFPPAFSPSKG